jgi:DnaJ family protein A protein 2
MVGKMRVTCPDCNGEGSRLRDKEKSVPAIIAFSIQLMVRCKKCKGDKVVKDKKRVEFQIEPGTENGERIALKGEGDEIVRPSPHC